MKVLFRAIAVLALLAVSGCVIREEHRGGGYDHYWHDYGHGHWEHGEWYHD